MNIPQKTVRDVNDDTLHAGNWLFFNYEGHEIVVYINDTCSRQIVYVDEQVISEKRTLGFKVTSFTSIHSFRLWGKDFRVTIQRKSYFEQSAMVSFHQDLDLIGKEEKHLTIKGPFGLHLKREKAMLFIFLCTFVVGFAASLLTANFL